MPCNVEKSCEEKKVILALLSEFFLCEKTILLGKEGLCQRLVTVSDEKIRGLDLRHTLVTVSIANARKTVAKFTGVRAL